LEQIDMLNLESKEIELAGYSYDPEQDIFYSTINAWQRDFGYCRLYDEFSAPLGMIVDCEPVYFDYENERWMIEFWKGQYDLTTGCEIGIYTTKGRDLNIPGLFNITFYNCVSNDDMLQMDFNLLKNGETLFSREEKHWWLTGFKVGEFSDPSELSMEIDITFKSKKMRNAFWIGLNNAGYEDKYIYLNGHTLSFLYDKPHTPQPISRQPETDWILQRKNEIMCSKYQEITKSCENMSDSLEAVHRLAPKIYEEIINMGKTKQLFKLHETISSLSGVH